MLHILALFCVVCAVCFCCQRKFEQVLPAVMLSVMLLLTALAMCAKLLWIDALATFSLGATLLAAVYVLAAKRFSPAVFLRRLTSHVLTPGFACFVLLTGFFLYATEPMVVWWKDDIAHWALSPKSLLTFHGLVDGQAHLAPIFSPYTPGLQVLQWWALHISGEWRESTLYFILFMTYVVFLLPLCAGLRWKRFWLMPVALLGIVVFPVWGNVVSYSFLGVDTSLSLCFGYTLIQLWQSRKGDGFALVSGLLGLCGLILIKQVGAMLAVIALLVLPLTRRLGKKEWLCILAPMAVLGGWALFCQRMGFSGFHTSSLSERFSEWVSGTYIPPEGADGVTEALWFALTTPYTESIIFHTSPWLSIPKILLLALVSLAPLALTKDGERPALQKVALLFSCATAFYLLLQFVSFFTVFYHETSVYVHEQKANMVLLMERYLAPVLLGFGMFGFSLIMEPSPAADSLRPKVLTPALRHLIAACLGLCFLLSVNWAVLYENLLPQRYFQHTRAIGVETEVLMDHDWATSLQEVEGAKILLGFEPTAEYIRSFRYVFAPAKFELPEVSTTENEETLSAYLRDKGITHLICFDEGDLSAAAEPLTEDGYLYPWTIYEVELSPEGVTLIESY